MLTAAVVAAGARRACGPGPGPEPSLFSFHHLRREPLLAAFPGHPQLRRHGAL
jgi:hypothetical protein